MSLLTFCAFLIFPLSIQFNRQTVEAMVQAVCKAAGMVACITTRGATAPSTPGIPVARMVYKITYKSATRIISEAACKRAGLILRDLKVPNVPTHPAQLKQCIARTYPSPQQNMPNSLEWAAMDSGKQFTVKLFRPQNMPIHILHVSVLVDLLVSTIKNKDNTCARERERESESESESESERERERERER